MKNLFVLLFILLILPACDVRQIIIGDLSEKQLYIQNCINNNPGAINKEYNRDKTEAYYTWADGLFCKLKYDPVSIPGCLKATCEMNNGINVILKIYKDNPNTIYGEFDDGKKFTAINKETGEEWPKQNNYRIVKEQ